MGYDTAHKTMDTWNKICIAKKSTLPSLGILSTNMEFFSLQHLNNKSLYYICSQVCCGFFHWNNQYYVRSFVHSSAHSITNGNIINTNTMQLVLFPARQENCLNRSLSFIQKKKKKKNLARKERTYPAESRVMYGSLQRSRSLMWLQCLQITSGRT